MADPELSNAADAPQGMPDPTAGIFGVEPAANDMPPEPGAPDDAPAPLPDPTKASEPTPEPKPDEAPVSTEYTEGDLVKEMGLGEYATVKEAVAARDAAQLIALKRILGDDGTSLKGNTLEEVAMEVDAYIQQVKTAEVKSEPVAALAEQGFKIDLEPIFKELSGEMEIDPNTRKILGAMADTMSKAFSKQLGEVQSRANASVEAVQTRILLNEAAAKAGDGPIPSADEAAKLLKANPTLQYRQRLFGENPMPEVINMFRAQKNSTGLTKAQEAQVKADADTVKRFKRQLTPGAVAPAKPVKPGELKDEALSQGIHNIPIHMAFPGAR